MSSPNQDLARTGAKRNNCIQFHMAIANVVLMHECCPQYLRMGPERHREDIESE